MPAVAPARAVAPVCAPVEGALVDDAPAEVDPATLPEIFPDVPVTPVDPAEAVISMKSPLGPRATQPVSVI